MKKEPPGIAQAIRKLKPREDIIFEGTTPESIRSIVSRIRDEDTRRDYFTKAVDNGVRVWRTD